MSGPVVVNSSFRPAGTAPAPGSVQSRLAGIEAAKAEAATESYCRLLRRAAGIGTPLSDAELIEFQGAVDLAGKSDAVDNDMAALQNNVVGDKCRAEAQRVGAIHNQRIADLEEFHKKYATVLARYVELQNLCQQSGEDLRAAKTQSQYFDMLRGQRPDLFPQKT